MKYIFLFLTTIFLIGCGGGGGSDSSSGSSFSGNFPSDSYSGTSYSLWDYTVPNQTIAPGSLSSNSLSIRNIDENTTEESFANNEKVRYEKKSNKIDIIFFKDGANVFQYSLKRSSKIGEQTTVEASSCLLVNHYNYYSPPTQTTVYQDVIQINCGKHKGYYAKGKGEVFKE